MALIKTPEQFFGKNPGDDRVMIHWHDLCSYYREAARISDRMLLEEKGKTSEGNDFLILYVSSPENLARLEEYARISVSLADPRGMSDEEISSLAKNGKAIVFQSYGLHSNEVGGPQMVPHMLYELLTSNEERILKILNEVIFIISPCSEPDGQIIFTEYYNKYLGTDFEGACSPLLRHNWAGHSNNRDAIRETVIESKHLNDIMLRRFMPQIFQDHHHQGPYENRMSISPKSDPICDHISPIVHRETAVYGSHMALALTTAGRKGIVSGDPMFGDFPISSFYGNACLHNISGMLTENADVRIASPCYWDEEKIKKFTTREHIFTPRAICPDPWEGGWWHLYDIVEQMYIASMSLVEYASEHRETILLSMAKKAFSQIKRGHEDKIKAYVITKDTNDLSSAEHLISILDNQRVDVYRLARDIESDGKLYPKGSYYIPMYQPNYAIAKAMLAEEPFNLEARTKAEYNTYMSDTANICMALTMGVTTEKLTFEIDDDSLIPFNKDTDRWTRPYDARENSSYLAANKSLRDGKRTGRDENGNFFEITEDGKNEIRRARIGLMKLSLTGNEEEGFTRSLLKIFDCDYTIILDKEIREGRIPADMDVIIIPGDAPDVLLDGDTPPSDKPPEYHSGLGTDGKKHLKQFVSRGGRLIAWEKSLKYISELFSLDITDMTKNTTNGLFRTGGSQLNAVIANTKSKFTYGMPEHFTLTHTDGPVLKIGGNIEVLASFPDKNILKNGVTFGDEILAGTPCMIRANHGDGDLIYYSFNPEYRTQQDGTYKLLLNALYQNI